MSFKALLILCFLSVTSLSFFEPVRFISANDKSKLEYTLTFLKIPYKRKCLPVIAKLELIHGFLDQSLRLKSLTLSSQFTSRNPIFRKIIDYEKYPGLTFKSTFTDPIVLSNNDLFEIPGNITFHGVTKEINVKVKINTKDNYLSLVGDAKLKMRDFGIDSPLLLIVPTDNVIKTKIELYGTIK